MGVANPQFNVWLVPWPWWILIGLAAWCVIVLLGWSWLATASQADKHLDEYAREHRRERRLANRAKRNGRGRP